MTSVCLRGTPLEELREGARVVAPHTFKHPPQSRLNVVSLNPQAYQVTTHSSCVCNEVVGLHNRHYPASVDETYSVTYFHKHCFNLPVLDDYKPTTKQEVVNAYVGHKKHVYTHALANLRQGLQLNRWTRISMFIKSDKYSRGSLESSDPKTPRAIQFRSPEFNLLEACKLKPYEHLLYKTLKSPIGLRVVAKGLNNVERATNIVEASAKFSHPVYILLDHSKFDSCVRVAHLKWTHKQYGRTIRNRFLRYLLSKTLRNRGRSKGGVRYTVEGGRMSGDFDTALGNTMINFMVLTSGVRKIRHHLLIDGDDSVLIMEAEDWDMLGEEKMKTHCALMGFKTKVEITRDLWQVEFCRSKLIPADPPRFARDPVRALSNYSVTLKDYSGEARLRYLAGIGQGEMAASAGVPILQAYALSLSRAHTNPMYIEELAVAYGPPGEPLTISPEVRVWFQEQWGIAPDQQQRIESSFVTPGRVATTELKRYYDLLPFEPVQ